MTTREDLVDELNAQLSKAEVTFDELTAQLDSLGKTALKVKRDRDELLEAAIAIESCLAPDDCDDVAMKLRAAIRRAKAPE